MKQFNALVSTFRLKALLCCSTAVLLTACGGNIETGSEQLAATAASVATDAGVAAAGNAAPAAAVEAIAQAPAASNDAATAANAPAPAASTEPARSTNTTDAAPQAADDTSKVFEMTGYDSTPMPAQAGQQEADAKANALASIPQ